LNRNIGGYAKIITKFDFEESLLLPGQAKPYRLCAIVVHGGGPTTDTGHYIAYVRAANGHWLCCDDAQRPRVVLFSEVKAEEAYYMMYEREGTVCDPFEVHPVECD